MFTKEEAIIAKYFETLGLSRDVTDLNLIEESYLEQVAKTLDPSEIKRLNEARSILIDADCRAAYLKALEQYNLDDGLEQDTIKLQVLKSHHPTDDHFVYETALNG